MQAAAWQRSKLIYSPLPVSLTGGNGNEHGLVALEATNLG